MSIYILSERDRLFVWLEWLKHLTVVYICCIFRRTVSHRDDRIGFAWPRHSLLQNPFATGWGGAGSTTANNVKAAGLLPISLLLQFIEKWNTKHQEKRKIMLSLNKHTNSTQRDSLWSLVPILFFSWCDVANVCQVALISWSTVHINMWLTQCGVFRYQ